MFKTSPIIASGCFLVANFRESDDRQPRATEMPAKIAAGKIHQIATKVLIKVSGDKLNPATKTSQ